MSERIMPAFLLTTWSHRRTPPNHALCSRFAKTPPLWFLQVQHGGVAVPSRHAGSRYAAPSYSRYGGYAQAHGPTRLW